MPDIAVMELDSLNSFCNELNVPGLVTIEYAPVNWLSVDDWDEIRTTAGNHQTQVIFLPGRDWLRASVLPRNRAWSEGSSRSQQGQSYQQTISGITPKLRPSVTATLERMEKVGYILRIIDRNGQPWLIGTPEQRLYFQATADAGDENGLNAYDITWAGPTVRRAAGYVPVI